MSNLETENSGAPLLQTRETLKKALLDFDPKLTPAAAELVVSDILESVDLQDPCFAGRGLVWIAENFYASHYLHAGWC